MGDVYIFEFGQPLWWPHVSMFCEWCEKVQVYSHLLKHSFEFVQSFQRRSTVNTKLFNEPKSAWYQSSHFHYFDTFFSLEFTISIEVILINVSMCLESWLCGCVSDVSYGFEIKLTNSCAMYSVRSSSEYNDHKENMSEITSCSLTPTAFGQ